MWYGYNDIYLPDCCQQPFVGDDRFYKDEIDIDDLIDEKKEDEDEQ